MKQYQFIRKITLLVCLILGNLVASAQAPAIQWDKTLGGNSEDFLSTLIQTTDGGYISGGYSGSGISGSKADSSKGLNDFWVIKLDASGNKLWDKTVGGTDDDRLIGLAQTSDGGYILGGYSISDISGDKTEMGNGSYDYWVVRLDANGNKLWDKTIGGDDADYLTKVIQNPDGSFILGGYSRSSVSGNKTQASKGGDDFWIVKLSATGTKIWDKTFGGNAIDELQCLSITADGGYIVGGGSYSGISGDKSQANYGIFNDYWIVKLNSNGTLLWEKTIGGEFTDDLRSLSQTSDGGYILGGFSNSGISGNKTEANNGSLDYWVVKLDGNGSLLWEKAFGGNNLDYLFAIQQTTDGNYILGGFSSSGISGDKTQASKGHLDYWILKISASGTKLWDKSIGGSSQEFLYGIIQTSDGGYILSGYSDSDLVFDKTQPSQGGFDYWIVKLGPDLTTGINETTNSLNFSISPNPSQGIFQLQGNNLTTKTAAITVSDLAGRTVYQQEVPVTRNEIQETINLPAIKGMYLMQLNAGGQRSVQKIVIE